MVTPVKPLGLMLGKMMLYFVMAFIELIILLAFMRFAFKVPIHGNVVMLCALTSIYLFVDLAIGMLVSVKANTQAEALQSSMSIMLPTIFLPGYVFPRATMPLPFFILSYFIPATYMIEIFRWVILRGAGIVQLWPSALALAVMGVAVLLLAAKRFSKMVV